MHEGIPRGGALVPELASLANRAVGNEEGTPLFEVFGGLTLAAGDRPVLLATEDGVTRALAPGESTEVHSSRTLRVRYVAVAGGLAVPEVLGGRGTLVVAGFGGHEGRVLRRGDRIAVGALHGPPPPIHRADDVPELDLVRAVRVHPGPDLHRFGADALSVLLGGPFTILGTSDRTGVRLDGPRLARVDDDAGRAAPMVRGAVQVPATGAPIVLGPDHPTTGGYPVLAVVARADLGRLFARPVGTEVRFEPLRGEALDPSLRM
jgi:biotin-dependent carboxylase-like uncharacterized protein